MPQHALSDRSRGGSSKSAAVARISGSAEPISASAWTEAAALLKEPLLAVSSKDLEAKIERGEYPEKPVAPKEATFVEAAVKYMKAGGERGRHMAPLLRRLGSKAVSAIDQDEVDAAALALYPTHSPATRNRKVYTPVAAILHHIGIEIKLRRPAGAKGRQRTAFLSPEDAVAIIAAAQARDPHFALLLKFLLYTGVRIGTALALRWGAVDLERRLAYVGMTKNSDPITVLLRADLAGEIAAVRGDGDGAVFPFARGGGLKDRLVRARTEASGVAMPPRRPGMPAHLRRAPSCRLGWVTFHTLRHTWGTWMRRYGGLDQIGLVATGNWRDPRSAARYAHTVAREEWERVERLPKVAG
jgi:integrase